MWLPAVAGIAGAVVVAIANFAVQRWRYLTDRLGAAIDHFCNEINLAADLAAKYWLLDAGVPHCQEEVAILEPMLVGRQLRLQEILLVLFDQDKHLRLSAVQSSVTELIAAMTGGQFRVRGRPPDAGRAQLAQAVAAQLNGEIRGALIQRNKRWI
jgi:hypothetical protein